MIIELEQERESLGVANATGAAIKGGTPIRVGGKVGIAQEHVAIAARHSPLFEGLFRAPKAAVTIVAGDIVGWDSNGNPYGGTAGTGAATNVAADMDFLLGRTPFGAGSTDAEVRIDLNDCAAESPVQIGRFASTADGAGVPLSSAWTGALKVYADDGGVALTAGTYRAGVARMLVTEAVTLDVSVFGFQGHLKVAAALGGAGHKAGLWGYCEIIAGKTVGSLLAGVCAMLDLPATAVIDTGCIVAGVTIGSVTLGGTHTGKAVAVNVEAPLAGAWDAILNVPSALTNAADGSGAAVYFNVLVNGVAARLTGKFVA